MTGALRTLRGLLEIHVVAVLVPGTSLLAIFFTTARLPSSGHARLILLIRKLRELLVF